MNFFQHIFSFSKFIFRSKGKYLLHSPFLYTFYTQILEDDRWFYFFDEMKVCRKKLLQNQTSIPIIDFGAGSSFTNQQHKSISNIVKQQSSTDYQMRILCRMIDHFESKEIIELGTSSGLSTNYLAKSNPNATVYGLEGNPHLITFGKHLSQQLGVKNIQWIEGKFDETLPKVLQNIPKIDLVFFDGHHTSEANKKYFEICKEKIHKHTIFVFDDINWSTDMQDFWTWVKNDSQVHLSIDLYVMGILFFDEAIKDKQHVVLRPQLTAFKK